MRKPFLSLQHVWMINFFKNLFLNKSKKSTSKKQSEDAPIKDRERNWQDRLLVISLLISFGIIIVAFLIHNDFLKKRIVDRPIISEAKQLGFKNQVFDTYVLEPTPSLKLFLETANKEPLKTIGALQKQLENQGEELVFAMNAGMFTPTNQPQGLFVEDYIEKTPIDNQAEGYGNFYLMPNGVFAFREDKAVVLERKQFLQSKEKFKYATQSGPMLVINGNIHPAFNENSKNIHIRNGVGVTDNGAIVFAKSDKRVNLYTFASLFRDHFNCPNALYLDGAISKIYSPELNKYEITGNLGPLVAVTKPKKTATLINKALTNIQSGHFSYKDTSFDVYIHTLGTTDIQFYLKDENQIPFKGLFNLEKHLTATGKSLIFAMNGGSFNKKLEPAGLLINNGKTVSDINLQQGKGNFYLQPNGIFAVTADRFHICESTAINNIAQAINFATQSGPLLLRNGKIHPKLTKGSTNLHIRNGVGLINSQQVAFVISNEPVNFYDFASFFKEVLHCKDALYLDGVNSTMFAPALGRQELKHSKKLGPIIAITEEK